MAKLALVEIGQIKKASPCTFKGEYKVNDTVVVENETGLFLGRIFGFRKEEITDYIPEIVRIATDEDKEKNSKNKEKTKSILTKAKAKAKESGLDMKIVSAEYTLDASKILITFASENRIDFRNFVKELAQMFKCRIELKQIGNRDEVKICGGMGICGKECCCRQFLPDFEKVSIKMAKNQDISLNPTKINGVCDRLLCCLAFENDTYAEVLSRMPKVNSIVETPDGKGQVTYQDILGEKVTVKVFGQGDNFVYKEFELKDIKAQKNDK